MSDINAEYAEAYFDECQVLKAEIARLKEHFARLNAQDVETNRKLGAEIERLRTWLGDSEMTVSRLRAALEELKLLTKPKTELGRIVRKALKSTPADETASATSPATSAKPESDK